MTVPVDEAAPSADQSLGRRFRTASLPVQPEWPSLRAVVAVPGRSDDLPVRVVVTLCSAGS
jgi:hypothetical protein